MSHALSDSRVDTGDSRGVVAPRMSAEDHFREAFAHAAIGMAVIDLTGRFLEVNLAYCEIAGYTEAELLATDFLSITHPDDRAENLRQVGRLLTGEITHFELEKRYVTRSGEEVWILNSVSCRRDEEGGPTHCIALCQNITERKRSEQVLEEARQALRSSEEQYRSLADLIPGCVWTARADGFVDFANRFFLQFTGLSMEQTEGSGWSVAVHPDDLDRVAQIWSNALATGEPVEVDYRIRSAADGEFRWFLAQGRPLRDRRGQVAKWFGLLTEIEEQKKFSQVMERQNILLRVLHDVTMAAYGAETFEEALQAAIDQVCLYTDWPVGHACVLDEASRLLVPSPIWHLENLEDFASFAQATEATCFAPGVGLPGRVLENKEPAWICDLALDPNFPRAESAADVGLKGAFAFPVLTSSKREGQRNGSAVVAVLEFFTYDPQVPDEHLLRAMTQVGIQLGHMYERKRAEESLRRRETELRRQTAVITELTKDPEFFGDDLSEVLRRVTEAASSTLDVARASIWLFDRDRTAIVCRDLYEAGERKHTSGAVLEAQHYPRYFAALAQRETIPADDARTDPRTREFAESYLVPLGITSMLDTVIRQQGQDVGVVCCEHVGPLRRWSAEEQSFAASLASLVALALETHERRRAEERVIARTRDMEAARDEADRANRAKSEFLSRMSHELRTPLNAILGFAQLLEMGSPTPRQVGHVEQILKGGRHLLALINEVLDLARIEAGQVPLAPESISVRDLVAEVFDLIRPLAEKRSIRLDPGFAEGPDLYVLADAQRLKQVFLNLLSNAVKYNREEGIVTCIATETPEGRIRIEVRDTGPGIASDLCERLFAPFERLNAASSEIEGTGLGLAVSKRLTEAMGGTIGCASVVGEGSTFCIELPRGRIPQGKRDVAGDDASRLRTIAGGRSRTVLYIEDNPDNLALVQGILGYRPQVELLSAIRGSTGLDLARSRRPDLILLDAHLPDQKGDEVMRQIRADSVLARTPVIVVSADATLRQIERLRSAGASEYLTKPIDVASLLTLVDRYLNDDSRRTQVRTCPTPDETNREST